MLKLYKGFDFIVPTLANVVSNMLCMANITQQWLWSYHENGLSNLIPTTKTQVNMWVVVEIV